MVRNNGSEMTEVEITGSVIDQTIKQISRITTSGGTCTSGRDLTSVKLSLKSMKQIENVSTRLSHLQKLCTKKQGGERYRLRWKITQSDGQFYD